jgi:uncharacterized protein (TIGR00251 family)
MTRAPRADTLLVQVQPRASRSEVVRAHGDAVRIRLSAPPVDGVANDELVRFLARHLGVRRSDVTIVRGATARLKTVRIAGLTGAAARERLLSQPQSSGKRSLMSRGRVTR